MVSIGLECIVRLFNAKSRYFLLNNVILTKEREAPRQFEFSQHDQQNFKFIEKLDKSVYVVPIHRLK